MSALVSLSFTAIGFGLIAADLGRGFDTAAGVFLYGGWISLEDIVWKWWNRRRDR